MNITLNYYPGGYKKAVTLSYDDGTLHDRRLVSILNNYGVKGTFHLNTARLGSKDCLTKEEIRTLYKGHEIALHTHTHPSVAFIPDGKVIEEVIDNRKELEAITGNIIAGMSYPNNSYNDRVIEIFKNCGVLYSRTTNSTGSFLLPDDFMKWNPTIHHSRGTQKWTPNIKHSHTVLLDKAKEFIEYPETTNNLPLLYVWGHSYEFENDGTWDVIENFCEYISKQRVWFATNIEIYNYITSMRNLRFSADCRTVYNPSDISVWIGVDYQPKEIKSGEIAVL